MRVLGLLTAVGLAAVLGSCCYAQGPDPLGMANWQIGGGNWQYDPGTGAGQQGVEGGIGLNNIGLLIRTWGLVTHVDAPNNYFYIDDGSGRFDPLYTGIRVSYDNLAAGNSIIPPAEGTYAAVTGISSTIVINSKVWPNLLPRNQPDIQGYP